MRLRYGTVERIGKTIVVCWVAISDGTRVKTALARASFGNMEISEGTCFKIDLNTLVVYPLDDDDCETEAIEFWERKLAQTRAEST